jgi:chain length determinant protein tyrosine kinase EpsG
MSVEPMAADPEDHDPADKLTNVIPAFVGGVVHPRRDRSIGAILLDAGRLSLEDAERILQVHRERGIRFGEAGKALGLIKQADIDFALYQQFDYPYLVPGESKVSPSIVAAFDPSRPEVESLRVLRSQLMLRWFDNTPTRKVLAVISAAPKEGRSFITANLAVVFAQLGERTLLIDGDLRNPVQHSLFGLDNRIGLSAVLSRRAGMEVIEPIKPLRNLFILPAGAPPPNPHELLARRAFSDLLDEASANFDVVLLDSPPASTTADAQILAVRAGAALIVTRKNASRAWRVQGISDKVLEAKATIVGAVLNDY